MKIIHYIIAVAASLVILLLSIRNCSNNRIDDENIISAVAQSRIDQLQTDNMELVRREHNIHKSSDSLYTVIKGKDKYIHSLNVKMSNIALKYETELNRLNRLDNDSAVGEFLDNAECGELDIIKYDSLYLIPICPIKTYNDLRAGFNSQVQSNAVLVEKVIVQQSKNDALYELISNKDEQLIIKDEQLTNTSVIIGEKDKQIESEHKKYKQQKVITWVTGGAGIVLLSLSLLR